MIKMKQQNHYALPPTLAFVEWITEDKACESSK
jgi:hypothetical protein